MSFFLTQLFTSKSVSNSGREQNFIELSQMLIVLLGDLQKCGRDSTGLFHSPRSVFSKWDAMDHQLFNGTLRGVCPAQCSSVGQASFHKAKVTSQIPGQGTCQCCVLGPWSGHVQERQLIDVSFSHGCFSSSCSLSLPLSLKEKEKEKKVSVGKKDFRGQRSYGTLCSLSSPKVSMHVGVRGPFLKKPDQVGGSWGFPLFLYQNSSSQLNNSQPHVPALGNTCSRICLSSSTVS